VLGKFSLHMFEYRDMKTICSRLLIKFNSQNDNSSNPSFLMPEQISVAMNIKLNLSNGIACTIHICLVQTKTLNLFFDLTRRQQLKVRKYVGKSDKIFVR